MTDCTEGKLVEAIQFARNRGDQSLIQCLKRLKRVDKNSGSETRIYTDFAPYSLYFVRERNGQFSGNGGIIFHGRHDNGGDGSEPTFSVSINPTNGWSIHT